MTSIEFLGLPLEIPLIGQKGTFGDLTYTISNNEVTITGVTNSAFGHLVIPSTIANLPVTTIDGAWTPFAQIEEITIPHSVTTINVTAFSNLNTLKRFRVDPNNPNYTSLDYVLFNKDKTKLIRYPVKHPVYIYHVPFTVKTIGREAFKNCHELKYVYLEGQYGVYNTGARFFTTSPSKFSNVTTIEDEAFASSGVTRFTVAHSITNLGDKIFSNCLGLNEITFNRVPSPLPPNLAPDNTDLRMYNYGRPTVNTNLLGVWRRLHEAYPSSQIIILEQHYEQLITFPPFPSYKGTTDAPFPLNATASSGLPVTYTSSDTSVATINGNIVTITGTGTTTITASCGDAQWQFAYSKQTLTVSKKAQVITFFAFDTELLTTDAPFPLNATASSGLPVTYTSSDTSVATINGSIVTITGIGTTTITASQNGNFEWGQASPVSFNITVEVDPFVDKFNYVIENNKVTILGFPKESEGSLNIPSVINFLPVVAIDKDAFSDCTLLTSVHIPNSIEIIRDRAFRNCTSMESIFIPNSVTNIRSEAFRNCSSLYSVRIPDSVVSMSTRTFYDCISLTNAVLSRKLKQIGSHSFYNCKSLRQIDIPDAVSVIGRNAFQLCGSLESIIIPDNLTTISERAFQSCPKIETIVIGRNVGSIGDYAFYPFGPSSLVSVYFQGSVKPSLGLSVFPDSIYTLKARAGFGSTFAGKNVTQEMRIKSTSMDTSNNLRIETDALNTTGLKVLHTSSLNSPFTEVTGVTKEGEGTVTIPAGNSAAQGTSGFYKVIYQE